MQQVLVQVRVLALALALALVLVPTEPALVPNVHRQHQVHPHNTPVSWICVHFLIQTFKHGCWLWYVGHFLAVCRSPLLWFRQGCSLFAWMDPVMFLFCLPGTPFRNRKSNSRHCVIGTGVG